MRGELHVPADLVGEYDGNPGKRNERADQATPPRPLELMEGRKRKGRERHDDNKDLARLGGRFQTSSCGTGRGPESVRRCSDGVARTPGYYCWREPREHPAEATKTG